MHWTLSRTACVCACRRLRAALHGNPLLAAFALVTVPGLPLLALIAGRASSPIADAAAHDAALARALAVAVVTASTTLGIAFASLAPTRALLGRQFEPAPLRPIVAFVGLTLLPTGIALVPLAILAFAFALPAFGELATSLAFLAAVGAGLGCGIAATEAMIGATRGSVRGAAAAGIVVALWLAAGTVGGSAALGPAAALAKAADEPSRPALATLLCASFAAIGLWGVAAAARPAARKRTGRVIVRVRLPARAALAAGTAMTIRLARNTDGRRHLAAGMGFAVAGAFTLRALVGAGSAPPYFAVSVALLAAAAIPLIAAGLRRDAFWLLRAAPESPSRLAAADAAAAITVGLILVAAALAMTAPFARLGVGALLMLEATVALVLGAAAASGAVVPWRDDRVLEQIASYTFLAVVAGLLTVGLSRGAPAASAFGLSSAAFATLAAHVVLIGGVGIAAVLEE
jgi:hypothetical protein